MCTMRNIELHWKNQMEMKLLASKVNPHFLFNTLNMTLNLLKTPDLAEIVILNLSDLLRNNLEYAEKSSILIEDEISNVLNILTENPFDLVINIPKNFQKEELTFGYQIRRKAVDHDIPLITNLQLAKRFVEAVYWKPEADLKIKSWDEY